MMTAPAPDEDDGLVFVYGPLRRQSAQKLRMEDATFIASGEVEGRLVRIADFAGWIPCDRHWVKGEVFQVSPELLNKLDEFHRGLAAEHENGGFQRMRVEIHPEGAAGMIRVAWSWQWTGPVDSRCIIPNGDWLDAEQPRTAPWLTMVAFACLIALPLGIAVSAAFWYSDDSMLRGISRAVGYGFQMAPIAACVAAIFAERRRERWILFRVFVLVFSGVASIFTILEVVSVGLRMILKLIF